MLLPVRARPLVGDLRLRYDEPARLGVPAHVTRLFPFMAPSELSPASGRRAVGGKRMHFSSLRHDGVSPQFQRQGIGTALIASVLAEHGHGEITVQTGVKSVPALSLYARAGFVEPRRWFVGASR